jgi:glycosyltransferase involved in cell wall biosynthesis
MAAPLISICIPAYNRTNYLDRLLKSIEIQKFKDFEIIISDDSPNNSVEDLISNYKSVLNIHYFKNTESLGTPANWNFSISKANGNWIKIMHDDDWFANENSLSIFAENINLDTKFIFCSYSNFSEKSGYYQPQAPSINFKTRVLKNPLILIAKNEIGPPSVTLFHKTIAEKYDERLKWRVDQEYYIRILNNLGNFTCIDTPLINIGVSESQVTNNCLNIPEVEIPELGIILNKFGVSFLKNIKVYDAVWRILRNVKINSKEMLFHYSKNEWPEVILNMIKHQSLLPYSILKIGPVSKLLMIVSYLNNKTLLK